jgi:hypothetical protein
MLRTFAILLPATLLAACAHSGAAPGATGAATTVWVPAPITRYADANRDGKVTRAEARVDPNLERNFDHYDANDDGVLDRGEFAQLEEDSRRELQTVPARAAQARRGQPAQPPMMLNRTGVDPSRPETE